MKRQKKKKDAANDPSESITDRIGTIQANMLDVQTVLGTVGDILMHQQQEEHADGIESLMRILSGKLSEIGDELDEVERLVGKEKA